MVGAIFLTNKSIIMVTVTGYAMREAKDGREFITLELSGGLELVQSQETGKFYATARKCSIPSTFNEKVAEQMIGSKIEGDIVRVKSDPYEFADKKTGEIITLMHSWAYRPKGSFETIGTSRVEELVEA